MNQHTPSTSYAVELSWFDTGEQRPLAYLIIAHNLSRAMNQLIEVHERYPNRDGPFAARLLRFDRHALRWRERPLPRAWLRYRLVVPEYGEE